MLVKTPSEKKNIEKLNELEVMKPQVLLDFFYLPIQQEDGVHLIIHLMRVFLPTIFISKPEATFTRICDISWKNSYFFLMEIEESGYRK